MGCQRKDGLWGPHCCCVSMRMCTTHSAPLHHSANVIPPLLSNTPLTPLQHPLNPPSSPLTPLQHPSNNSPTPPPTPFWPPSNTPYQGERLVSHDGRHGHRQIYPSGRVRVRWGVTIQGK